MRVALVATLLGALTGLGYFMRGGVFAPLSDATSFVIGMSLIPVALALHAAYQPSEPALSYRACVVGVLGLAILAAGGLLLVLAAVAFPRLPSGLGLGAQFLGIFLQGIWLGLVGVLAFRTGAFDRRIGWAAVVAGGGYALFGLGSTMGPTSPLAVLGGAIGLMGFVAWAVWTGERAAAGCTSP